ncbi:exosome nuclease subunit [Rhizina undulata]
MGRHPRSPRGSVERVEESRAGEIAKDWIADTLKLRRELEVLNEVFADPGIVEVLHGANVDIDINMISDYFDVDKTIPTGRLADTEMLDYARSDIHFLLYIFGHLRNELLIRTPTTCNSDVFTWNPETSKVHRVLAESKEVALRRYEREVYDPINGTGGLDWKAHLYRNEGSLNGLFNLARRMPVDVAKILNCCHGISPPVRPRATELAGVIRAAKESLVAEEAMNKKVVQPL